MREIRQSGSEGGGNEQTVSPYPYGSWGKKKKVKEKAKEKVLLLKAMSQKKTPPTSKRWMGKDCLKVTK